MFHLIHILSFTQPRFLRRAYRFEAKFDLHIMHKKRKKWIMRVPDKPFFPSVVSSKSLMVLAGAHRPFRNISEYWSPYLLLLKSAGRIPRWQCCIYMSRLCQMAHYAVFIISKHMGVDGVCYKCALRAQPSMKERY